MKALARALAPILVALSALDASGGSMPLKPSRSPELPTISPSLVAEFSKPSSPLGLEGYCPVTLLSHWRWQHGEMRFATVYDNRTYFFASAREQAAFLESPQKFVPLFSGCDPYLAATSHRWVNGRRKHGIVYKGRIVLFATEESHDSFNRDPKRFLADVAASPPDPFRSTTAAPPPATLWFERELNDDAASAPKPDDSSSDVDTAALLAKYDRAKLLQTTNRLETMLPVGSPPLGLDGYCPVTLINNIVWKRGDLAFGTSHKGRTYLFASAAKQAEFLKSPDRFAPILSGNDPYFAAQGTAMIAGSREFGIVFRGQVMLFASPESLKKFSSEPEKYLKQIESSLRPPLQFFKLGSKSE